MKLIADKYKKLLPDVAYLSDPIVLAQAWKKTHQYMRTHNWYADTLALDISALGLEENSYSWAKIAEKKGLKPYPMELVPAAKSEQWHVDAANGWRPSRQEDRTSRIPIRPLAHLMVRDQTLATALMMCLADAVETAQGDCSNEGGFSVAQRNRVYSYGNRLVCDWNEKRQAWFRWGNSETYRRFFTDYQNFLLRPVEIGRFVAQSHAESDNVYVLNFDLESFYDRVDRAVLISRLKKISEEFGSNETCSQFWDAASSIVSWEWDQDAAQCAGKLNIELGNGLPQGLVASGFFANAFLLDFDQSIGRHIGNSIQESGGIILHDYCRYVDDVRLVVSIEDKDVDSAVTALAKWFGRELKNCAGASVTINSKKTKITALSDLDNRGSLSGRIALLQQDLSGPADRDILDNASAVLEGLLSTQFDEFPDPTASNADRALIRLAKFDHDVRPDTLKRFSANRLESIMRNKRKLQIPDGPLSGDVEEFGYIENECELLAKKLIRAWMQDPSLSLVLRKAIEIYPSANLVEPVFHSIFYRSSLADGGGDICTQSMMDYLLADLFRCCVDFGGQFENVEYPKSVSSDDVFDIASGYAQRVVAHAACPKFLKRQALLLLAVLQKPVFLESNDASIQHALHAILVNRLPDYHRQYLALFEVAAQITGRYDSFASLLLEYVGKKTEIEEKYAALEVFAKRGGEFWSSIWSRLKRADEPRTLTEKLKWASPSVVGDPKSTRQKLSRVIASNQNGFEHEAALIKLGLGLLDFAEEKGHLLPLSPSEIEVKIDTPSQWYSLWHPDVARVTCSSPVRSPTKDPRFAIPLWIASEGSDNATIYWIGCVLRAAAVGGSDFTGHRWKSRSQARYKGLRTGWYKRRMGMMHSAEALVGEYATVSTWFSELLMASLQWPGFEATHIQEKDIFEIADLASLRKVLCSRLAILNKLCCRMSDMPTLITSVCRPTPPKRKGFRVVTVQQLLPRTTDFSKADPTLSGGRTRAENRDHLSRLSLITCRTLSAKLRADHEEFGGAAGADLIVFPEVAVHPDDQDVLKRLADKTKSVVLAGLVFHDNGGRLVNIARWFIPDYRSSGRRWIIRDQGKKYMTTAEQSLGITGYRPCQHILEIVGDKNEGPFRISGAICYDATDLKLAADLKGKTDLFIVCAHNKDVATFDTMASALNYHMYQHVVVVNKGEFGGSTIQAPFREHFDRLISHAHGADQISINVADLDLAAFRRNPKSYKSVKKKPAGL